MNRQGFSREDRIRRGLEFKAVFNHRHATTSGPLRVHTMPAPTPHSRLGLAVSRKVGNAVRRNRIKRLLRTAFQVVRDTNTHPMDIVIVVLPHTPQSLEQYRDYLSQALRHAEQDAKS
jgi:ribonuclease P protein component